MSTAIWGFAGLVVVAIVSGIVGPYVMLRATAKQADRDRAEEKAEREAEAKKTADKLEVIHTLVDGQMTAMMESELDMAEANLVLLREAAAGNGEGGELTIQAQAAIKTMEAKVRKLTEALADRKHQMALAEEQIRQQGERT